MLDWIQVLALALVQGITEFLPISSSAHLILLPKLMGWPDQGLDFDIAVHIGTLLAVLTYFRHELCLMLKDLTATLGGKEQTPHSKLALAIGLSTIPVGLAGFLGKHLVENTLRPHAIIIIACSTMSFGVLLGYASWRATCQRGEHNLTWRDIAYIGLAQVLALIPGTSRSGITMTAGLMLGLTRQAAARFSFYMSIPVILLAGGLETIHLLTNSAVITWQPLLVGILLSGISAFCCIHIFLKLLVHIGLMPFVLYRLALGAAILYWLY